MYYAIVKFSALNNMVLFFALLYSVFIFQFCDVAQVAIAHNYIAKLGDMKNMEL